MARTDTLNNFLTDVAEAIREKEGTTEVIPASEFDTRISNLSGEEDLTEVLDEYNSGLTEQEATIYNIAQALQNKSIGGGETMDIYTVEELKTNKLWFGEPVYRRVAIIDSIGNNVNYTIPYDCSYMDQVWINNACSFITNQYETLTMSWIYSTTDYLRIWLNKNIGIRVKTPANLEAFTGYIVLEYTKPKEAVQDE